MLKQIGAIKLFFLLSICNIFCQESIIEYNTYSECEKDAERIKTIMKESLLSGSLDSILKYIDIRFVVNEIHPRLIVNELHSDTFAILNNQERALLAFYFFEFESVLQDITDGSHFFIYERKRDYKHQGFYPSICYEINPFWFDSYRKIEEGINNSNLTENDKKLLCIYLQSIINQIYNFPTNMVFNQDSINIISYELISRNSEYTGFIQENLIYQYVDGKWGFGCDLTFGNTYFKSDLSDFFTNGGEGIFDFDLFYKRIILNMSLGGFSADIKKRIIYKDVWDTTGWISSTHLCANIGCMVYNNTIFRVGFSGGIKASKIFYIENYDRIDKTKVLFQPDIALIMDLKFNLPYKWYREKNKSKYLVGKEEECYYIRLYGGYHPLGFNDVFNIKGSIYYFRIGLGGFLRPAKRITMQ